MNRLIRVVKEGRSSIDVMSDSRKIADINLAEKASAEHKKSSFAAEKVVRHGKRPTGTYYAVRW